VRRRGAYDGVSGSFRFCGVGFLRKNFQYIHKIDIESKYNSTQAQQLKLKKESPHQCLHILQYHD